MTISLLEINDIQSRMGIEGQILGAEPGWALCTDPPLIGEAARKEARRQPRLANSQFWHQLTTVPMPGATDAIRHHADLAFLQLEQLSRLSEAEHLAIAIPAHYEREDLRLLLGLAEAANIHVKALIDPAVLLAQRAAPDSETVLYLDASLHALSMTTISQGPQIQRQDAQLIHPAGYQHALDRLAGASAARLIQSHRFDPMHQAETEQQLFDQLYPTADASIALGTDAMTLHHDSAQYDLQLTEEDLRSASAEMMPSLVRAISAASNSNTEVLLSHRTASLPGVTHAVSLIPGIRITVLSSMALFEVFAEFQPHLQQSPEKSQLILSRRNPKYQESASTHNPPSSPVPTHVLQNGIAIDLDSFLAQDHHEFVLSKVFATGQWQVSPGPIALSINQRAVTSLQTLVAGDVVNVGSATFQFIKVS